MALHLEDALGAAAIVYFLYDVGRQGAGKATTTLPRSLFFRAGKNELVRSFSESARTEISHEDLRKLIESKSLNAEWGGVEFKFPDASLASLKDFISRRISAADVR